MTADWERVCRVDDVEPERPIARIVGDSGQDRDRVCVVLTKDAEHVAMLDRCPHRDIALSGGIVRDDTLVCPGHFWRFDLSTGVCADLPGRVATVYPTRVVDGWVEARLPPAQPHQSMREWLLTRAQEAGPEKCR